MQGLQWGGFLIVSCQQVEEGLMAMMAMMIEFIQAEREDVGGRLSSWWCGVVAGSRSNKRAFQRDK